jgi:RNA polymerase sigma factor (sigma-70 family)
VIEREKLISMVQDLKDGKEDAAAVIYETFHKKIYYQIYETVNRDAELAADLTQDTFIEILQSIGSLQEPAAFVTWSKQIAFRRCTAHFKKRHDILVDEDEDGYSVFDTIAEDRAEFIPDEALDKEDLKKTIQGILNDLPEEQRSAIMMRYFDELPVAEIAKIQNVSEGTVKSRLNYGRKSIKQSVESYEKKNGIKLHCAGVIPLLLWFLREYRLSLGLSLTTGSARTTFSPALAGNAAKAAVSGAAKAVKAGLLAKVIAGIAALAVTIGGVTVAVSEANKDDRDDDDDRGGSSIFDPFGDKDTTEEPEDTTTGEDGPVTPNTPNIPSTPGDQPNADCFFYLDGKTYSLRVSNNFIDEGYLWWTSNDALASEEGAEYLSFDMHTTASNGYDNTAVTTLHLTKPLSENSAKIILWISFVDEEGYNKILSQLDHYDQYTTEAQHSYIQYTNNGANHCYLLDLGIDGIYAHISQMGNWEVIDEMESLIFEVTQAPSEDEPAQLPYIDCTFADQNLTLRLSSPYIRDDYSWGSYLNTGNSPASAKLLYFTAEGTITTPDTDRFNRLTVNWIINEHSVAWIMDICFVDREGYEAILAEAGTVNEYTTNNYTCAWFPVTEYESCCLVDLGLEDFWVYARYSGGFNGCAEFESLIFEVVEPS